MRMSGSPPAAGLEDDDEGRADAAERAAFLNGQIDMLVTVVAMVEGLITGLQAGPPPPRLGADLAALAAFQTDFVLRTTDEVLRLQHDLVLIAESVIEERLGLSAVRRPIH